MNNMIFRIIFSLFFLVFYLAFNQPVFASVTTSIPYLPQKTNFGGQAIDVEVWVPAPGDFTLEAQAIAGNSISIAGGKLNYTPSASGTIRFAHKNGKLFVYENGNYVTFLKSENAGVYPGIFEAADDSVAQTGIYDKANLLKNPGFETVSYYFNGHDPVSNPANIRAVPIHWNSVFAATNNRVNGISTNPTYQAIRTLAEGNNTYMLHGYNNTTDGRRIYQKIEGLKPGTYYRIKFRQFAHMDTNSGSYTAAVGDLSVNLKAVTYSAPPQGLGNYTDIELDFLTPETLANDLFFSITRSATSIAHLDRMTLVEGSVANSGGISGVTNAVYLAGNAYAPEFTLKADEVFEFTESYLVNASVESVNGWSNASIATGQHYTNAPDDVYLHKYSESSHVASMFQKVEGLPDGYYRLEVAVRSNTHAFSVYAIAGKEYRKVIPATGDSGNELGNGWQKLIIDQIEVTSGKLQVGLSGGARAFTWVGADDFRLFYYTDKPDYQDNNLTVTYHDVIDLITRVNDKWQSSVSFQNRAFWDNAAYHTGNMEAYAVTGNEAYREYSYNWSQHNNWKGATSDNKAAWKYSYGESMDYVLFGDWQICFQTYIDLYTIDGKTDPLKIARTLEVMEYQMSTSTVDYWWWADGLYMVMPVMTKLYKVTGNQLYLDKLYEYFVYADNLMYDTQEGLYYRDGNYVYPKQPTINGTKNFWSRGAGWVFAGLAKVLQDYPKEETNRAIYVERFEAMARALKASQQPGGYWSRSILDVEHAPGYETSGTAFFTYGLLWGINNGYLSKEEYMPVAVAGWNYLQNIAVQPDNTVGYIQPIGAAAIPSQIVRITDSYNFGVGAFLLAASELSRMIKPDSIQQQLKEGLQLHYDFKTVNGSTVADVSGNGYDGTLINGASVETSNDWSMLKLGYNNGYLDMGTSTGNLIASLADFSVASYLYIDSSSSISGNGHFAWVFSTTNASSQNNGRYIAYRVNTQRYAQSNAGWGGESALTIGSAATKGVWQHVVYTQTGSTGTLYINGQAIKSGAILRQPRDIGTPTTFNWLGRPQFTGDAYLKGTSYADFRVYNRALPAADVQLLAAKLADLNYEADSIAVEKAVSEFSPGDLSAVRTNLTLPSMVGDNVSLSWISSAPAFLLYTGNVNRPAAGEENVDLTLTARFTRANYSVTRSYTATVLAHLNDADAVDADAAGIQLNTARCYYKGKINLPSEGIEGSVVTWVSSEPGLLTHSGDVVGLPANGEEEKQVILTATIQKGASSVSRPFSICINEEEEYTGYLFAYFTGNSSSDENIFFALSNDGYNYKALNGGRPVVKSDSISIKQGVRDPHITRGPDGNFYMVVTDMRTSEANCNWACNWGIVLLKSADLVNWTHSRVDVKAKYPAQFGNIVRAWAPQSYYDEETGKMMVYFSMRSSVSGSYDIIYYAYANADFTDLETMPQVLFNNGNSTIDGDIIHYQGRYHLFFKTEDAADKGYKKAVSDRLTGGYVLQDRYLDQTNDAVEGACVFRMINQDKYILMYDVYTTGRYEFTESTDLENFSLIKEPVTMDFKPRHGTVIPVTKQESARLLFKWDGIVPTGYSTEDLNVDKGAILRTDIFSIDGRLINQSLSVQKGIYIIRKVYESGAVDKSLIFNEGVRFAQ